MQIIYYLHFTFGKVIIFDELFCLDLFSYTVVEKNFWISKINETISFYLNANNLLFTLYLW